MAIIVFGELVTGVRGTLGGTVYSANASGPYVTQWRKPTNPRTEIQTEQRERYARKPFEWRSLTAGQRTDWATFAADPAQEQTNSLGESYYLSGYHWFVKCNTRLEWQTLPPIQDAPVDPRPAQPSITYYRFRDWYGSYEHFIQFTPGEFTDLTAVIFCIVVSHSGRAWQYPGHMGMRDLDDSTPGRIHWAGYATLLWGTPQAGDWGYVKVAAQSDEGLRSSYYTAASRFIVYA